MFNQYPYLNLNDLNLDYLLNEIKSMYNDVTNFVSINAIKYADPIQWNITSQYEKNTVVIDPLTGTAYISVAAVPSGVALTRTEYWTVVFDLGSFVTRAAQNFTQHWESDTTTTATFSTSTGSWLVWGDVLYKALTNITAGDSYVVGGNIEHFTIEDLYNAYLNTIAQILATVGDLTDLTTTDKTSIVAAINEVVTKLTDEVSRLDNELADEADARLITGDLNYCENYWTYVDGVNGNDENDGLSASAPFKTLEKALDKLNQRETSVVIRILTAGTYKCNKQVFNGITLHIQSEVDNVIIDFSDENRDIRIYNCHLNFSCLDENGYLTLKNDYNSGMTSIYFENSATSLTRVKFTNHIICYGGNIESLSCQFRAVRFRGCNAWLADPIFNNDDVDQSAIQAYYSSVLTLTGTFTHNDTLPSNGLHGMIRIERSLLFNAIINSSDWINNLTTYKYLYGLSGGISTLMITREVYYYLQNYSHTGTNSYVNDAILNNENCYLPAHGTPLNRIPANSDLNDYINDGQYRTMTSAISQTITNTPYTSSGFRLDVIHLSNPYHVLQVVTGINSEVIYLRHGLYNNNSWSFNSWFNLKDFTADLRAQNPFLVSQNDMNDGDDLNSYTTGGIYRCTSGVQAGTLLNCPYTSSGFVLTVKVMANSSAIVQTIDGVQGTDRFYRRTCNVGGTFNPWYVFEGTQV